MKKLYINGEWVIVKIHPLTMAISELMIIVPKREGQKVTWHNVPGDMDHCGLTKDRSAYCITTIKNADYNNCSQNVYRILCPVTVSIASPSILKATELVMNY